MGERRVRMLDILVVDDDDIIRESIAEALVGAGHRVAQACDGEKAMLLFGAHAFDVAVCDVHMPKMDGLTLCRRLRRESPGTALVVMTSYGNVTDAVASLRGGAVDYVSKPFDPDEFAAKVMGPIAERYALRKRFEEARSEFVGRELGASLVGTSLVMRQLSEDVSLASKSDAAVLILGERGAGKKLVARMIHAESPRRDGPFVLVPCGSIPDLMLLAELSELTEMRSRQHRDEWFRAATGGTLVLDGIDCLSSDAQERLVRILDEPILRARRGRDWQPLGVRVISLAAAQAENVTLRNGLPEPLRMRLDCLRVRVPALREREGDLYLLVCHFLRELTPPSRSAPSLTPRAWQTLASHSFRANVRELVWVLEYALARAEGGEIDVFHLPEEVTQASPVGVERTAVRVAPW
jgi:two-component system, NtrC family, response regulator HydG